MSSEARDCTWQTPQRARTASDDIDWLLDLRTPGPEQARAMAALHQLMLRAAAHQVWRMSAQLAGLDPQTIDVLINQSADEAMAAVLRKVDTFEGRSRFTTWAYKFAILQAASDVRRAAWRNRDIALEGAHEIEDTAPTPAEHAEAADLGRAITAAMTSALTPHQRGIATALLIDHVPVDVLAERLATNRNALYKTLHDARVRLRECLIASGHLPATPSPRTVGPTTVRMLEGGLG